MTEFLHDEFIAALSEVWFTFSITRDAENFAAFKWHETWNFLNAKEWTYFSLYTFASSQKLVTWILIQCKSFSIIDLIFSIYMTLQHAWTLFHSREEEEEREK